MNTVGSRLIYARKLKNISQEQLCLAIGCSQATITKIESDKTIRSRYIGEIAKFLEIPIDWLQFGSGTIEGAGINFINSEKKDYIDLVPIVSWVSAGNTSEAMVQEPGAEYNTVKCKKKHSSNTYALKVIGNSMTAPVGNKYSFPEGYIIIVDFDQRGDISDGIFVIAKENGDNAVTFKQLKYDGTRPYLNPLNPDHPKIFKEFRIIGKVIDWDANLPELP